MTDLLKAYQAGGGRSGICSARVIHNGFTAEQMAPEFYFYPASGEEGNTVQAIISASVVLWVTHALVLMVVR
ncbi:hypothetical protein AB4874_11335 [Thioclava sp. 15-R06ZXC-3]|uniref:Uncharacterized protein n=1 Tax=Thioclava arctica TaxID=3238301 RepID=A0ABV3TLL6_9RHOB